MFLRSGTISVLLVTGIPPSVAWCLGQIGSQEGADGTGSQVFIGDHRVGEYLGPSDFSTV